MKLTESQMQAGITKAAKQLGFLENARNLRRFRVKCTYTNRCPRQRWTAPGHGTET
jgi:hypothetical protein